MFLHFEMCLNLDRNDTRIFYNNNVFNHVAVTVMPGFRTDKGEAQINPPNELSCMTSGWSRVRCR